MEGVGFDSHTRTRQARFGLRVSDLLKFKVKGLGSIRGLAFRLRVSAIADTPGEEYGSRSCL